ncbi:hypothetical protein SteCoe_4242 [Stentor coeruleus]|uniref:Endonuclease/exonuclease/phosphatase domain-containing protein n=1 Tax=Stentor coeruleus TaxID=5963 RepID=A0A1R2CV60_9CILI|nr:hypothetical protein SteCoe_4242 [Stentor coeruleus]
MDLIERFDMVFDLMPGDFKVMQWNVLADQLATDFPAVDPRFLQWEYRKGLILKEIDRVAPDLLCVEEMDHYEDYFKQSMEERGFCSVYRKKGDWHNDGLAIFYKKDVFEKHEEYYVEFPGSQFAIGLMLQKGPQRFYIFVTHLKAKKAFDDIRVTQVQTLLSFIQSLSPLPTIVCGDFNSLPDSNAYLTMYNNTFGLNSIYRTNTEPEFTTVKQRASLEIKTEDYIWEKGFKKHQILSLPSIETIGPKGLPKHDYPSDHLSLIAVLSFNP